MKIFQLPEYKSCLLAAGLSAVLTDFGVSVVVLVDSVIEESTVGIVLISNCFSVTFKLYCCKARSRLTGDTFNAKLI